MPMGPGFHELKNYSLLEAMTDRRSRRFPLGAEMTGPMAYKSSETAVPLTDEEEALLAFAASGITAYALADLPYPDNTSHLGTIAAGQPGTGEGGTTILAQLAGRTTPSGDALDSVIVFVMNDSGTYALRRPQDLTDEQLKEQIALVRAGEFVTAYHKLRVPVNEKRVRVDKPAPYSLPFNKWAANLEGTTYFLPVSEVTTLYINCLLWAFGEDVAYYVVDERNPFNPHAPVGRFRKSKGGHLDDDPDHNVTLSVGVAEAMMYEFAALEQGTIIQNLGLMTQALGLGGFAHYAAHPFAWFEALGFKMADPVPRYSRTVGADAYVAALFMLSGTKDISVPTAVGFGDSWELRQPYCPPNWPGMREAVVAYADKKLDDLTDPDDAPWLEKWIEELHSGFRPYSDKAKEATIVYCEQILDRYHMFPAHGGPFRTELAYQAHHLDLAFYDRFYKPEALSETQHNHQDNWHREQPAT